SRRRIAAFEILIGKFSPEEMILKEIPRSARNDNTLRAKANLSFRAEGEESRTGSKLGYSKPAQAGLVCTGTASAVPEYRAI
ncbi:MAG: hypothetical protein NZM10_04670, partial [Fimbriimonadales bacterium]|nr:hypothetical protein [Fimbriimonadales bacterium]